MICYNSFQKRQTGIDTELLPNPEIPIVFSVVKCDCESSNNGSSFNSAEVEMVMHFITKLLNKSELNGKPVNLSDIGIVTPYKQQCKNITKECDRRGFRGVTVGTAEMFQGQGKPIIIISTLRTNGDLGFVNNERVSFRHFITSINQIDAFIYYFRLFNNSA